MISLRYLLSIRAAIAKWVARLAPGDSSPGCILTGAVKRSYGLPKSATSAMVRENIASFGLGSSSLQVDYSQKHASLLIESLRDLGKMGIVTKALLDMQLGLLGGCHKGSDAVASNARHCLRVRQLSQCHDADITIMKGDIPQLRQAPQILTSLMSLNPNNSANTANPKTLKPSTSNPQA